MDTFRSIFRTAGIIFGAILIIAGYVLDGIGVLQLGLPVWVWQAIGATIFLVLIGSMIYDSHETISKLDKPQAERDGVVLGTEDAACRSMIADSERGRIADLVFVGQIRVRLEELEQNNSLVFDIQVSNGSLDTIEFKKRPDGFMIYNQQVLSRPQFDQQQRLKLDRGQSIFLQLRQKLDAAIITDINSSINTNQHVSFRWTELHVNFTVKGQTFGLKLPDGVVVQTKTAVIGTIVYLSASE
jgi:hypothetical protein